jgi:riboflavin kinase/FMN adenylyltransferase
VTNVGRRPTFKREDAILAEAHLLDFDAQVYGRRVELSFEHHLRPEQRFPGLEALKTQIAADVESARELLGRR